MQNPRVLARRLCLERDDANAFKSAGNARLHSMRNYLKAGIDSCQERHPEKAHGYRNAVQMIEEALGDWFGKSS